RDGPTFSDEDVRFVQVVASLTAQALRNAHRYERLEQRNQETGETVRRMELERLALLSFLRRLLAAFGEREGAWAEGLLPRPSSRPPTAPPTASAPRRRAPSRSTATSCRCCRSPTPSTKRSWPSGRSATPGSHPK